MSRFNVRQVAVLGAGVMGAQIAAHLVNVQVPVILFDLPAKEGPKSAIAQKAIDNLKKLKPAPLGVGDDASRIRAANYEEHLDLLKDCDLVIEAIAERMDWKHDLYAKIAPFIAPHAILASNTSGLSITTLSDGLPDALKPRFCGIHFFNPPRYMYLVELIPTPTTEARYLDQLETFVTSTVGKGVVRAKDTPNFIANRVGIAGMLATIHEAQQFGLSVDLVDDLTGKKFGRASSGTFRTADVVGLDTMAHVIRTLQDNLGPDKANDPFFPSYATPPVLSALIAKGALGQKVGAGFYKKAGRDILRLDAAKGEYVPSGGKADPIIDRILKKPAAERLKLLRESSNPQAQFLWAILRDSFHYVAVHLATIADSAREVDFAMRWGFGAKQGPFELWQEAGWQQVAKWVQEDIDAGKALCNAPLPAWVFDGRTGVHTLEGSWSAAAGTYVPRSALPVYQRQHFPESLVGAGAVDPLKSGTEVFRNEEVRVWTLDGEVLIASITAKLHLISPTVTEGLLKAVELAEAGYQGLVIWSPDDVFSAGANLESLMPVFMKLGAKGIAPEEKKLQDMMLRVRYASVPVVAAVRGMALGGGCELAVHCAQRVAAMESYVGLVEVGVGLIPGGGGLTYVARRAAERAASVPGSDLLAFLKDGFQAAAMATVGTSALESRKLGYLLDSDIVVPNKDELLHVALSQAKALANAGYRAPVKAMFPVAGRSAIATIKASLVGMRDGGFISQHDFHIASLIADVVCGGEVDAGTLVTEEYLMALERKHFCALLEHPKSQERIMGMLQTGKPVRN
ncbi:3-hydroxyacyl-CoA dehydrogenase/enoyl-CoA hydratase family protein [Sphaerotilus montanus]|uniref:3-hydroxyacyl-CoA dehydrogenase n=1 Tax=Sphaerotilus montanus TaxID=522889 RepID=A0A7Y9R1K1_9BURK|nr:3-hydroxyacyl-CoA dehydrogenase/enoyl-CoA hydratase family protein [Sphaerotilus montanus]NYG33272.1 3-hydroxyacyl-CoA dehydrogenase [Sphaerotilus montanus]NZD58915.1 3-hydroxyacyl-CoA dehydrogenase/enoyl-CoA hydratase family protein [Sphaerotilus montanus]